MRCYRKGREESSRGRHGVRRPWFYTERNQSRSEQDTEVWGPTSGVGFARKPTGDDTFKKLSHENQEQRPQHTRCAPDKAAAQRRMSTIRQPRKCSPGVNTALRRLLTTCCVLASRLSLVHISAEKQQLYTGTISS